MHQKSIKLSDFGLSRKLAEVSSRTLGAVPYVDPKCFSKNYKLNKKSDVYSIGVLMWQISSGCKPFSAETDYHVGLALEIINGRREEIINGTLIEYSNLYEGK